MARASSSRCASVRSHSSTTKAGSSAISWTPVKPRIVRQAHRIGAAERNGEDRSAPSADNDPQPGRRETELRHAGLGDFRLGQDAIRSRVSKQLERAVEARLEASWAAPCVARQPACVRTKCQWPREAVTSTSRTSSTGIVISPFGNERLKPWTTASAGKRQCREETRSAECGGCPGQPVHRRHHHIALPANAISPGISRTVTRKMPRICSPVSETVGSTSTGGLIAGARSSRVSQRDSGQHSVGIGQIRKEGIGGEIGVARDNHAECRCRRSIQPPLGCKRNDLR